MMYRGATEMDPFQTGAGLLPPALRALALSVLVETVVPLPAPWRQEAESEDDREGEGQVGLWRALRRKCGELSALVVRADDPEEAAAYVLGYLPKHFESVLEAAPVGEGRG
jgi:hypothetical protein